VVNSLQRIASSDIRAGVLDSPLGSSFSSFGLATEDASTTAEFAATPYALESAYIVGQASQSPTSYPTSQDMAFGRNVLDRWFDSVSAAGTTDDAVGADVNNSTDPNYVTYEADLQGGDSGAPLFVDDGSGGLTLVGINWFVDDGSVPTQDFIGMSYIGNYDQEIQTFISANAVPEPAHLGLLLTLFLLARFGLHRRVPS